MVTILNLGAVNENIVTGCLPEATPESLCGTRVTVDGNTIAICCCKNVNNCNNEAFVNNCKTGKTPTTRPKQPGETTPTVQLNGFTCVGKQPKPTIKNYIECSGI